AEAVKVLVSAEAGSAAPVAAASRVLEVRRRPPDPDRVKRCYDVVGKDPEEVGATEGTFGKEIVKLGALLAHEPVAEAEVQAVQVGPAVFVSNPAELFCQFGLDLKAKSPFPLTFPVELANGCVGYIPTEEAFGPHGGGYETRLTSYSNLEITAGRKMADAGLQLARQLDPGAVPEPPRPPPFVQPWSYGDVRPELK